MQTVPAANSSSAGRPRRKPFTAIRKGRAEHVLSGRLRGTAFAVYIWLHMQADRRTGTVRSNAGRLAAKLGLHPVTVRRDVAALREGGYIRYATDPGSRQLYEIAIEKYARNFEGPAGPGAEQVPLQAPLHERAARARKHERIAPPKKIEERTDRPRPQGGRGLMRLLARDPGVLLLPLTRDGRLASPQSLDTLHERLPGASDCFLFCHGWLVDQAEAREGAARFFARLDRALRPLGDRAVPLRVAVHWPSKPSPRPRARPGRRRISCHRTC